MADQNILDLQALFGQAKAIKVKARNGKTYELLRMEGITPREAVRFQKLQVRAQKLQRIKNDISDEQAAELSRIFDDLLLILCKDLPLKDMEYAEKIAVVRFYMEQTQGKKTMELALRKVRTGARSSRK